MFFYCLKKKKKSLDEFSETETSDERITHSLKFDKKRTGQEVYEIRRKDDNNEWVLAINLII